MCWIWRKKLKHSYQKKTEKNENIYFIIQILYDILCVIVYANWLYSKNRKKKKNWFIGDYMELLYDILYVLAYSDMYSMIQVIYNSILTLHIRYLHKFMRVNCIIGNAISIAHEHCRKCSFKDTLLNIYKVHGLAKACIKLHILWTWWWTQCSGYSL